MTIDSDSVLIYNGIDIGCGPYLNDIFGKNKK